MSNQAEIVHVGLQSNGMMDEIFCWARVTLPIPMDKIDWRTFRLFATGEHIPSDGGYVYRGTVVDDEGYVWHLMERMDN